VARRRLGNRDDSGALVIEGDDYFARCLRQMEDRREAVFVRRATMAAELDKQVTSEK
jgi:hypothetical protein